MNLFSNKKDEIIYLVIILIEYSTGYIKSYQTHFTLTLT